LVCVLDQSADTAHTVVELNKGDSFGELAIVNRSQRQSTVVCKTDCDFLAIDIPAYEAIFMQGGQKTVTDPDHEEFVRSLDFLRGWPIQHLQKQHAKFMFCYFKRSVVMVKNSRASRWIYIVK
uniref:Cyclic nucleotide-binding domain-containing protein n=2 Tax=Macrostomum lignano TaxID=282301 RepID=A0A1I8GZ25_9PLAT